MYIYIYVDMDLCDGESSPFERKLALLPHMIAQRATMLPAKAHTHTHNMSEAQPAIRAKLAEANQTLLLRLALF